MEFGDSDPEDAWDDGDPVVVRLALLGTIMADIFAEAQDGDLARAEARKAAIRPAALRLFAAAEQELA